MRRCASWRTSTSPASRSTRRCRETPGRAIGRASASSPAAAGWSRRISSTIRRLLSANACSTESIVPLLYLIGYVTARLRIPPSASDGRLAAPWAVKAFAEKDGAQSGACLPPSAYIHPPPSDVDVEVWIGSLRASRAPRRYRDQRTWEAATSWAGPSRSVPRFEKTHKRLIPLVRWPSPVREYADE